MFNGLKVDLMDWDFWKLIVAAVLWVIGMHFNVSALLPLSVALGIHTIMPA
jgi:hypothetical protein